MDSKTRFSLIYVFLAFWGILLLRDFWVQQTQVANIPYSEFEALIDKGQVEEIVISDNYIQGSLKNPAEGQKKQFVTARVEPELSDRLQASGVKYTRMIENTFWRDVLSWTIPALLFIGLWAFLIRRMSARGGLMSIGKSKAKIYVETDTKTTFQDVAGVEEAKAELKEVVDFLKAPKDYGRLGAHMPKGVLLVGPPGTGKTMLAKAVAGEAGVPFFSISGSEFVEMFVGVGAARVRDLFEQARKTAPCIIFIDELDALGRSRGANPFAGGHDEKEQTLNQLLVELDGFDSQAGIVLLAATNRPEILDPALLRAGRFDRQILVDRPDKQGRLAILRVHSRKLKLDPNMDLEQVAVLTPGFTGADLANLVNEAALVATRRKADVINVEDFTQAIERIVAGLEKRNRLLNPFERRVVAHHEMGHAIAAASLPGSDTVHKISIIPRGIGSLGYTIQRPTEDRFLMTRPELQNKMAVLLGGRAAEKIIFGHLSTGASDDIARATDVARSMVMRYGMVETLGSVAYDNDSKGFLGQAAGSPFETRQFSEVTAREIDAAVKTLVDQALHTAESILRDNRDVLEDGARELLQKETLVDTDLQRIFSRLKKRPSVVPETAAAAAEAPRRARPPEDIIIR